MAFKVNDIEITSILNSSFKTGRDSQNLIDFATTDNKLIFRVNNVDEIEIVENVLQPTTNDGVALGTGSLMWSDLFLANLSVINFNNGDVTLTHGANSLTVAGGTLAAAAITGTTIDATTDFTVGGTVITDGALADGTFTFNSDLLVANGKGLVVGHTAQVSAYGAAWESQVLGTGNPDSGLLIARFSNTASGGQLLLGSSRGTSIDSHTIVQDGDSLGRILFAGSDGGDMVPLGAMITGSVDGTPGANDMPGRLVFGTTADGAQDVTERMRINAAGLITIADGGGLVVGHSAALAGIGDGTPVNQIIGTTANDSSLALIAHGTTDAVGPYLVLGKSGHADLGGETAVVDDELLGAIRWVGMDADSGDMIPRAAEIKAFVDGTPGANDMPGRLGFYTTADGVAYTTERMRIDSGGLVTIANTGGLVVGHSAVTLVNGQTPEFQQVGVDYGDAQFSLLRFSNDAGGPDLTITKSRGAFATIGTIVADDDTIGRIIFLADDGGDLATPTAMISSAVDGGPSANDVPGRLVFSTNAGGTSATERMRIDSAGKVGIGIAAPDSRLHVWDGTAGTIAATANTAVTIEKNGQVFLQFLTPNNVSPGILFGDPDDSDAGRLLYNHSTPGWDMYVEGALTTKIEKNRLTFGSVDADSGSSFRINSDGTTNDEVTNLTADNAAHPIMTQAAHAYPSAIYLVTAATGSWVGKAFFDMIVADRYSAPTVVFSRNNIGSPPARTYSIVSSTINCAINDSSATYRFSVTELSTAIDINA
jgi:hypothetical protein